MCFTRILLPWNLCGSLHGLPCTWTSCPRASLFACKCTAMCTSLSSCCIWGGVWGWWCLFWPRARPLSGCWSSKSCPWGWARHGSLAAKAAADDHALGPVRHCVGTPRWPRTRSWPRPWLPRWSAPGSPCIPQVSLPLRGETAPKRILCEVLRRGAPSASGLFF